MAFTRTAKFGKTGITWALLAGRPATGALRAGRIAKKGTNEVVVFDMIKPRKSIISVDKPILDQVKQ